MRVSPQQRERGARILIRFGLVLALLAALLWLPSPNNALAVVVFNSLLLSIFAMLVIGLSGRGFVFVTLSAFILTVALPVLLLTLLELPTQGSPGRALAAVFDALTEGDPFAGVLLVAPTAVVAAVAAWLDYKQFRLPRLARKARS